MIPDPQKKSILEMCLRRQESLSQSWDKWSSWFVGDDGTPDPVPDGYARDSGSNFRIDTNYMFAFLDTMMAVVIPSNPQVNIRPNNDDVKDSARAREALLNSTFRRGRLDQRLRRTALFASLMGVGFIKTVWRASEKRIVYQALSPRMVFYDESVPWEDCRWLIEAVPYTKQDFEARLENKEFTLPPDKKPVYGQIPKWIDNQTDGGHRSLYNDEIHKTFERLVVYEFHDLGAQTVTWFLAGDFKEPIAHHEKPFRFVKNPYARLVFNEGPDDHGGIPDAKLIEAQQKILNELDMLELWHAYTTIPKPVVDDNAVDDPNGSVAALKNANGPGDIIRVKLKDDRPTQSWLQYTAVPAMTPAIDKMRDRVSGQISFTLGMPEYQRGEVGEAKLATEAALADTATRTRNGARQAMVKALVRDVALTSLGLWREFMPKASEVFLQGRTANSRVLVDRLELAFGDPSDELSDEQLFGEEWFYDYEIAASSPGEQDKAVRLQRFATYLQAFVTAPNVDQARMFEELANLLGMPEIISENPAPPMMPGMPGAPVPGVPGSEGNAGVPGSPVQGNALPNGLAAAAQAALPPEATTMGSPPKMEV